MEWLSVFAPSKGLQEVQEDLHDHPERFLEAVFTKTVELEEVASCMLGRVEWFDSDVRRPEGHWISRRSYCDALMEFVQVETCGVEAFDAALVMKLAERIRFEREKFNRSIQGKLQSVPEHHIDTVRQSISSSFQRKLREIVADWRAYRKELLQSLEGLGEVRERVRRFVVLHQGAKERASERFHTAPGQVVSWTFSSIRIPLGSSPDLLVDQLLDDAAGPFPELVTNLVLPAVFNTPPISGPALEAETLRLMKAAGAGDGLLGGLRFKGTANSAKVKQELDAILYDLSKDNVHLRCIVECKVNLRAAISDAEKLVAAVNLIQSGSCVVAKAVGPFQTGTSITIAEDAPLVYLGALDDMTDGAVMFARGMRNLLIAENPSESITLQDDGTYVLLDSFRSNVSARAHVLAQVREVIGGLSRFYFGLVPIPSNDGGGHRLANANAMRDEKEV